MLKWVQALMSENPLPDEMRTNLSEQSVFRAIENQKRIIEELENKHWRWENAGILRITGDSLIFMDPHWYQDDFDPFLDEPYWIMAEVAAQSDRLSVDIMCTGEKPGEASAGRIRLMFDYDGLDQAQRERTGLVDLECHNILMVSSRGGAGEHWQTGGPLNRSLLEVEMRSRRQFARDHQHAVDLLSRSGYTLKPLSHGYDHEFDNALSARDLERVRDLLIEADIPGRVTCTVAQTFAEVDETMKGKACAAIPDKGKAWAFAFDAPSDGVIFALMAGGRLIGYEIDFIAGLKEVFYRQKDLIHQSMGKMFKRDTP